jgi:4-amino-4-deoxychorismate lyase
MTERVLINGIGHDCLSVTDRGLRYGDGLFETIHVVDGRPRYWEKHMARLRRGAQRLMIPVPVELEGEAREMCEAVRAGVLKITLTRGQGGAGYFPGEGGVPTRVVQIGPPRTRPAEWVRSGICIRICRTRLARNPSLAGIKHLNRLEQVLARAEWRSEYAEGLMRDNDGLLIEGTMTNLFVVREGTLLTPDLSRCGVEGVMREVVIETAWQLGIPVRVAPVTIDDLSTANEVFLTNALVGLWPVREIDGTETGHDHLSCTIGPVTRRLQEAVGHA